MTERDRAAGRLLLDRGLATSEALRRCALVTQERRQRGEQIEVLQVLVEQGALDRSLASTLWRELQAPPVRQSPPSSGRHPATRQAPQSAPAQPPRPGAPTYGEGVPTLRGDFMSGSLGAPPPQGFPPQGFPGAPPQGFGSGAFVAPPPAGGYGAPPPLGFGSGSFNAPPPATGYGSGSFNAPGPGYGPGPGGFGSGSFNAPGGYPQISGFGQGPGPGPGAAQQGFGQGFGGPQGFAPGPGMPGMQGPGQGRGQGPGQGPGQGFGGPHAAGGQGMLDGPPLADTVRSPVGGFADADDLASTVKQPSGRQVGPVDFQSDFDPMGSGFGEGPPPAQPIGELPPPAQQPEGLVSPALAPPSDLPDLQAPAPAAPKQAGTSSRNRQAGSKGRPVSARARAARAKREQKPNKALVFGGIGAAVLILVIGLVIAFSSSKDTEPSETPTASASPEVEVSPEDAPRVEASPDSQPKPSAAIKPKAQGPIPASFVKPGSAADAPLRAEALEESLVIRCNDMVEKGHYQEAVDVTRAAIASWPEWLARTPAAEHFKTKELAKREKQLRFAKHLSEALKTPGSKTVEGLVGAIGGQHLSDELGDLPCVSEFVADLKAKIGEDEYDAIFVKEFEPKELQEGFGRED